MPYDVRAIANFVLDRAESVGAEVSNMHINKIIYFLYCWYLAERGSKLTNAKIEAWDFGPVFREIYQEFKIYGKGSIKARARRINLETGKMEVCVDSINEADVNFLSKIVDVYIFANPIDLVNLTHKKDTPWYKVYHHGGKSNPKMEISDNLIFEYFKMQPKQ